MKRRLLIIAVFLLLGAVVNVAVAWGCAIWSSLPPPGRMHGPAPADQVWWQQHARTGITSKPIFLSMAESFGSEYRLLTAAREDEGIHVRVQLYDDGSVQTFEFTSGRSNANIFAVETGFPTKPWDQSLRAQAGWPLRSMAGERWRAAAPFTALQPVVRTLALPAGPGAVHVAAFPIQQRFAPLRPLWPGFAVNTLFYAAILWLLIPGPFALRRFLRSRRGLCPKCAYPMGASPVCTECGRALPKRLRPAT